MRKTVLACVTAVFAGLATAQTYNPNLFGGLHWRLIGPFRGGRALAVAGVPGTPERFYFGAVGGGVWQTDNAGRTWTPIFDNQSVASIGAIAVAPSDPNIIYVGTGEADMRSDIQQGDGMYKSTDAGKTWSHIGLEDTRQIGKILVDPKDPNTVYVAALGHQYGPNAQRGVFVTTDGGATWAKSLDKGPDVGAIDMAMDPSDSNVIFTSLWQTRRPPWSVYPPSNGPGSGLYRSVDAGKTWNHIMGSGFPAVVGRVGVSISPADHNRIYTVVDTNDPKTGGVYRSDDGGATWDHTDGESRIWGRGWYFTGVTADPKNPDLVYVMNTSTYRSTDGGKTFTPIKGAPGGDDYHTLWIEPNDPDRMILAGDQGVIVSVDGAKTWSSWYNQPTGQFYHVIADNRFPYWVYGSQQDSGAMAVPSSTIHAGINSQDWRPIGVGGESDTIAPDPLHPGLLFGSPGSEESLDTGWERSIDPTLSRFDTIWRSEWTHPIAMSPTDPHVLYVGHQKIFRTANGGDTWQVISPDLTRKTPAVPANLDSTTAADHTGLPRRGVVYWIAPSPIFAHEIWAGTDDGLIWLTRDEGAHWRNVTPTKLTAWSKVGVIDASHFNADTAYAAVDRHRLDNNHPYIYRTHDAGKSWTLITNGIPENQFVNVVREDPKRAGLLYAGTDWGVFVSFDDGKHWQSLQLNLPTASVRDIVFSGGDIVVGTHGRAIWVLDEAAPLRQLLHAGNVSTSLFKPANACLVQRAGGYGRGGSDEGTPLPAEEAQAQNPPWGALVDYVIAKATTPVAFEVRDARRTLMRRFSSADKPRPIDYKRLDIPPAWIKPQLPPSSAPGAHRFVWNLRYGDDNGPIVPPGIYTVRMAVNGRSYSQRLTVVSDPRVKATVAELHRQFDLALQISAEIALVRSAQSRAQALLKTRGPKLTAARRARLKAVIGSEPSRTPDGREVTAQDIGSLRFVGGALAGLSRAVEGGPGAPTSEYLQAFAQLKRMASADIAALAAF